MVFPMSNTAVQSILLFVLHVFVLSARGHGGDEQEENPKLIIVSFDGFRWDYLSRTNTPNFDRIVHKGVRARYGLKNAFITNTLPNHFTLATGLYEESHGIVGNVMYDPVLKETFDLGNRSQVASSRWFDVGAEPIWVTNQLQKKNGRSGCMQWIGCEALIKGVAPSRHVPYIADMKNETRIDETVGWFTGPYPVNLGLIYFQEPDETAHDFGPDSPQVTAMIGGLDKVVGYLLDRLEATDLLEHTNLIITSDHGFAATGPDRVVNLDNYITPDSYRIFSDTPVAAVLPNDGN